jgi:hypothetical protein
MESIIRIFIAYSFDDKEEVDKIVQHFREMGRFDILWNEEITPGVKFSESLRDLIAFSHVLVPIISIASLKSGWVHQEIGYAMALNIPVLPISLNEELPEGLLAHIHADPWNNGDDFNILRFERLIKEAEIENVPFIFAKHRSRRYEILKEYGNRVITLLKDKNSYGHVRNKGALSVFAIPDEGESLDIWNGLFGTHAPDDIKEKGREERQIMEEHARNSGFSLIINPTIKYDDRDASAVISRIDTLIKFLENIEHSNKQSATPIKALVAMDEELDMREHLTIVGDYFYAETHSAQAGSGLRNTIFTRNAHAVKSKVIEFDELLMLKLKGREEECLKFAIQRLEEEKKKLENPSKK